MDIAMQPKKIPHTYIKGKAIVLAAPSVTPMSLRIWNVIDRLVSKTPDLSGSLNMSGSAVDSAKSKLYFPAPTKQCSGFGAIAIARLPSTLVPGKPAL